MDLMENILTKTFHFFHKLEHVFYCYYTLNHKSVHSQTDTFVEILWLVLKMPLHSNKQLSLLFITSVSEPFLHFPNHQHYGQSIDSTIQGQKPSERPLPLPQALSLKAKWISAANTQRDEQLFQRWGDNKNGMWCYSTC